MKLNFIISVICSLLLGYLCATFLFESQGSTNSTFQDTNQVYFLEYTPIDEETKNLSLTHISVEEKGKNYIYVGMTTLEENAKKIEEEYQKQGITLSIQSKKVESEEFVNELSQYDILLKSTKTREEMNSVLSTILSSYEEFVLNQ